MVGMVIQLVHDLGDKNNMKRVQEYKCTSRFEVHHLDIVEDFLDEDQMIEVVVRKGWTLYLVFGVGKRDEYEIENTKFRREEVHSHELGVMVGLAT
jgi:phosphotransferase system IIB component